MLQSQRHGDAPSHLNTEDVGRSKVMVVHQRGDVIGHGRERQLLQVMCGQREQVFFIEFRRGRAEAGDIEPLDQAWARFELEQELEAARAAQAHDFILEFPEGYESELGQRGVNLSGGQKQRLSIARALLVQPKVLILDDSTSSVDVETEARIQESLEQLLNSRDGLAGRLNTTFVVAQRISTVLNADKILVLEKGHVVEMGTHADLLKKKGYYSKLYEAQFMAEEVA